MVVVALTEPRNADLSQPPLWETANPALAKPASTCSIEPYLAEAQL
jgi:hypothetical protein